MDRAWPAMLLLTGLADVAGCSSSHEAQRGTPPADLQVSDARAKLEGISRNAVQLWVVVHVRAHKTLRGDGTVDEQRLIDDAVANADAVVGGGGDLIMLINSRCEMPLYERVIRAVRERHPDFPLGISALSYGPTNLVEGFRLARMFNARVVWTETVPGEAFEYEDDDGTYKPAETTPRELALRVQREQQPRAMHVSGVHMKYTRPADGRSFPEAMQAALGSVDGINITGPQTGVLADVERVKHARQIAGRWPLGLASGVSVENIASVVGFIDYAIVGTSLKDPGNPLRTDVQRVRALRDEMNRLGGGPRP